MKSLGTITICPPHQPHSIPQHSPLSSSDWIIPPVQRGELRLIWCIRNLLLDHKLLPNVVTLTNNEHLLSHGFWGSGIQEQLSCVVWFRGLSRSCSQDVGRGYGYQKA